MQKSLLKLCGKTSLLTDWLSVELVFILFHKYKVINHYYIYQYVDWWKGEYFEAFEMVSAVITHSLTLLKLTTIPLI